MDVSVAFLSSSLYREMSFEEFQDGHHLGYWNGTILAILNNESTSTDPQPKNEQQLKLLGGLNAFYWHQLFALDSADAKTQTC